MIRVVLAGLGIVVGYAIVAGGLSLIVMTWWVNEWLAVGPVSIAAIAVALLAVGWIAGFVAASIARATARWAIYGVAGLTLSVLIVNIILDVAAEPLWFKVLAIALVLPAVLISGARRSGEPTT